MPAKEKRMKNKRTPIPIGVYRQMLFDIAMELSNNGQNVSPPIEKLLYLVDNPIAEISGGNKNE